MSRISKTLRAEVAERANNRCEYCRLHEDDLFLAFEIDHIVAQKHGGSDDLQNLAYACPHCNQHKGSDLVTILDDAPEFVPLFNPRVHSWEEHFSTSDGEIIPKTSIGRATAKLLQLNNPDLLILRKILLEVGQYP